MWLSGKTLSETAERSLGVLGVYHPDMAVAAMVERIEGKSIKDLLSAQDLLVKAEKLVLQHRDMRYGHGMSDAYDNIHLGKIRALLEAVNFCLPDHYQYPYAPNPAQPPVGEGSGVAPAVVPDRPASPPSPASSVFIADSKAEPSSNGSSPSVKTVRLENETSDESKVEPENTPTDKGKTPEIEMFNPGLPGNLKFLEVGVSGHKGRVSLDKSFHLVQELVYKDALGNSTTLNIGQYLNHYVRDPESRLINFTSEGRITWIYVFDDKGELHTLFELPK